MGLLRSKHLLRHIGGWVGGQEIEAGLKTEMRGLNESASLKSRSKARLDLTYADTKEASASPR